MGVAGIALGEAIPFNRVWNFPKKLIVPEREFLKPPDQLLLNVDATAWQSAKFIYRDENGYLWYEHVRDGGYYERIPPAPSAPYPAKPTRLVLVSLSDGVAIG